MSARDDGLVLGSKILCKYAKSMQHSIGNVFMSWMSLHYQHKLNISCSQQYLRKSDMGKKRVTLRDDNLEEEFTFSILFDSILTSHSHTSLSSGKKKHITINLEHTTAVRCLRWWILFILSTLDITIRSMKNEINWLYSSIQAHNQTQ